MIWLVLLLGCAPTPTAPTPDVHAHATDIAYWTCPMHPTVKSDDPDAPCPICGMDLVAVNRDALASGEVLVDAIRRQELGIRTAPVVSGTLDPIVRAVGVVQADEAALTDVTVRVDGYVERLRVGQTGGLVRVGQPLLELYSPELYATQQDLLRASGARDLYGAEVAGSARRRLELWGLTPGQIDGIVASNTPLRAVPLLSPASGTVVEKRVVEGGRVMAGDSVFVLADLRVVWVEAKVFEDQLDRVEVGQTATIALEASAGEPMSGLVEQVLPELDADSRSGRVRVRVRNDDGRLRVGGYASVGITTPSEPALLVPRDAVIHAGERLVVFVDRGDDRLAPREVRIGRRGADRVEVLTGLSEGDHVVVSGNFLVAAESRLQSATGFWAPGHEAAHEGH